MPCRHGGCRAKVIGGGYCPEHKPAGKPIFTLNRKPEAHHEDYRRKSWQEFSRSYRRQHPLCAQCSQPATLVDHIVPIAFGSDLYDSSNLQSLCSLCHDRKRYDESLVAIRKASKQSDLVTIVCGAPYSGHDDYVNDTMGPEDIRFNDSLLERDLAAPQPNERGLDIASQFVTAMRVAALQHLHKTQNLPPRVWVLAFGAKLSARNYLRAQFPGASLVVVDWAKEDECLARARLVNDNRASSLIRLWFRTFEPEDLLPAPPAAAA